MLDVFLSIYAFDVSRLASGWTLVTGLLGALIGVWINAMAKAIPERMEQLYWAEVNQAQQADTTHADKPNPESLDADVVGQESGLGLELLSVLVSLTAVKTSLSKPTPTLLLVVLVSILSLVLLYAGYGMSPSGLVMAAFFYLSLLLLLIDWKTQLLPDFLVYVFLWGGLFIAATGWPAIYMNSYLPDAIIGAVAGYGMIFITGATFFWLRGIPGIGLGDAKLLAALGCWCVWLASSTHGATGGQRMCPCLCFAALCVFEPSRQNQPHQHPGKPFSLWPVFDFRCLLYCRWSCALSLT